MLCAFSGRECFLLCWHPLSSAGFWWQWARGLSVNILEEPTVRYCWHYQSDFEREWCYQRQVTRTSMTRITSSDLISIAQIMPINQKLLFVLFMHQNRGLFSSSCHWPSGDRGPLTVGQSYPSVTMHGALIQTSAIWVFHHHRHTCNYSFCRSNIKYSPIEGDPHPLPCFFCTVSFSFNTVKLVNFYNKYFREM